MLPLPRSTRSDTEFLDLSPYPERQRGRLGIRIACPQIDGYPLTCSATVRIRERSRGRLLATGRVPPGEWSSRFLRLRLTALGRRRLTDARETPATARLRGRLLPTAGWTVRL